MSLSLKVTHRYVDIFTNMLLLNTNNYYIYLYINTQIYIAQLSRGLKFVNVKYSRANINPKYKFILFIHIVAVQ